MANILVIENDKELANSITFALTNAGFAVTIASSTCEGLNELFKSYPDVIIMDSQLAEAEKGEPLLKVRQTSFLPILVLGKREDAADGHTGTVSQGKKPYYTQIKIRQQ